MTPTNRCRPDNLCQAEAMPFQQHHECRTTDDVASIIARDAYFANVQSNLRVGDQIVICRYDSADPTHRTSTLLAAATVRVVGKAANRVHVALVGEIAQFAAAGQAAPADARAPEMYATDDWTVKQGFGDFRVVDERGVTVCAVPKKARATAIATGQEAVPRDQVTAYLAARAAPPAPAGA